MGHHSRTPATCKGTQRTRLKYKNQLPQARDRYIGEYKIDIHFIYVKRRIIVQRSKVKTVQYQKVKNGLETKIYRCNCINVKGNSGMSEKRSRTKNLLLFIITGWRWIVAAMAANYWHNGWRQVGRLTTFWQNACWWVVAHELPPICGLNVKNA